MILFWLVTCYHTPTLHNNAEKPTVIWFFTQILIESTVTSQTDANFFQMIYNQIETLGLSTLYEKNTAFARALSYVFMANFVPACWSSNFLEAALDVLSAMNNVAIDDFVEYVRETFIGIDGYIDTYKYGN